MKTRPFGSGLPARQPGWCGALQWVINRTKRGANLEGASTHLHQGRYQLGTLWTALLVSSGFVVNAHACNGDPSALSADFLALRAQRGHFEGASWIPDVDRWNGRKHQLMQQLSDCALQHASNEAEVVRWMGKPDAVLRCDSAECRAVIERAAGDSAHWKSAEAPTMDALWLYRWRGEHDQLVFGIAGGKVRARGWLSAGE